MTSTADTGVGTSNSPAAQSVGLLEALPILVAGITAGKIAWINAAGVRILGAESAAVLVGRSLASLFTPDYQYLLREGLADWLREDQPLPMRMQKTTGQMLDVEASIRLLADGRSSLLFAHDVTDKKQAALALLERERRISIVLNSVADGVVEFDHDGKILTFNGSAEAIFGCSAAEVKGTSIETLLKRAKGPALEDWHLGHNRLPSDIASRAQSEELVALRKDGGLFPVALTFCEFATHTGRRFVGAIRLVTEQAALEQTLLNTATRFRDFAESASDWFWEMDSAFRFTYLSEQFTRINRLPRENMIGRTLEQLSSPTNREILRAYMLVLRSHQAFKDLTYAVDASDGSSQYFVMTGKPVFDSANEFKGYRGTGRNVTVEKEAQKKAHAAETLLMDATESISEGLILYDADDRLVQANSRYKELYTGIAELLIPGMLFEEWMQAIVEHDVVVNRSGKIEDWLARRRAHRQELDGSIEAELSDGRWVRIAERPIRNGGIVGVHTEITKLKRAEIALRQNAEQFHNMFEDLIQGVVIHDNLKPLFVNQAMARTFGYHKPVELLKLDSIACLFASNESDRIAAINAARVSGRDVPSVCEFQGVRLDGSLIWLEETGSVIDWNGRKVSQSILVDISERKRQEQALRESEARLRDVIDNAPLKIGLTDDHGRYMMVNSLLARDLGLEPDAIRGKTAADLFAPDIAAADRADSEKVIETRRPITRDQEIDGPDGRRFEQSIKFPISGPDGAVAGVGMMIADLTEQRRVEEHLRESQKLNSLGRLAGGVAHDFNNLLMVIGGYAKRALAGLQNPDLVRSSLAEVITATDKAAGLTKQLLAFSRRQVLETRVFRAATVLNDLRTMLRPLLGETIELSIVISDESVCVETDSSLLSQALVNLAINARDAMPSGGPLRISLDRVTPNAEMRYRHGIHDDSSYVRFSVADEGTGMNPQTVARIFEPFFTTKEQGKGTGLGMAMVYGFVKQSGGFINVESVLGEGTTTSIFLRLADKQPESNTQLSSHLAASNGETILLVEDDDALRNLTQLNLEELGYRVLAAADGVKALEVEDEYSDTIHLLLSDVVMPALGGIELARILKQTRPEMKVILVSGYPARGDNSDTLGPDEFPLLQKPIALDALATAIRACLSEQSADSSENA